MDFQVGDQVMHWNFGLGKITGIEEMPIASRPTLCYVVEINQLTVWVPVNQQGASSLRMLTPRADFKSLIAILRDPGEPLPTDHLERKAYLADKLKQKNLQAICQVVRDLSLYSHTKKLNEKDKETLEHARKLLICEWALASSQPQAQVEKELFQLLSGHTPPAASMASFY